MCFLRMLAVCTYPLANGTIGVTVSRLVDGYLHLLHSLCICMQLLLLCSHMYLYSIYHKLLKIGPQPTPFWTLLWGKSGKGASSQIFNLSCACTPSLDSSTYRHVRPTIMITAVTFWKKGSFAKHVQWEVSGTCVDTKPRSIEATCIVSGDRDDPACISLCFWCEPQKALWWLATIILCVRVYKHNRWQEYTETVVSFTGLWWYLLTLPYTVEFLIICTCYSYTPLFRQKMLIYVL